MKTKGAGTILQICSIDCERHCPNVYILSSPWYLAGIACVFSPLTSWARMVAANGQEPFIKSAQECENRPSTGHCRTFHPVYRSIRGEEELFRGFASRFVDLLRGFCLLTKWKNKPYYTNAKAVYVLSYYLYRHVQPVEDKKNILQLCSYRKTMIIDYRKKSFF